MFVIRTGTEAMSTVTATKSFPTTRVRDVLDEFWDRECTAPVVIGSPSASVLDVGAELDSLTAVKVLLDLESILETNDLPETLIKRGGYSNKDEFLADLIKNLEDIWSATRAI
jgi:hypothetical protein